MIAININEYLYDKMIESGLVPSESEVDVIAGIVYGLLIHIEQQMIFDLNQCEDAPCDLDCDNCPFDD